MAKKADQKLPTAPYKGVRDFYPAEMGVERYLFSVMREVVERFGYEEYAASVLEPAELYRVKGNKEIVQEQTYTFTDRGGREVTLRPEMTPTVARMIAAKRRELLFPLRWYSIPNLFRYEKPQRGRVREHVQLNVDLFGIEGIEADVEIIDIAAHLLRALGLKDRQVEIHLNHRQLIDHLLSDYFKLLPEEAAVLRRLIDKKEKIGARAFQGELEKVLARKTPGAKELARILSSKNPVELIGSLPASTGIREAVSRLEEVTQKLERLGIRNTVFTPSLVRGFDYYTGIVFEIFDTSPGNPRSIFGGGRYDQLLEVFGVPAIAAVGFGVGDEILRDLIETYELLPERPPTANLYLCSIGGERVIDHANDLASRLREDGVRVAVDFTERRIGDQIRYADKNRIPFVACIGEEEMTSKSISLKCLKTGEVTKLREEDIAAFILRHIPR